MLHGDVGVRTYLLRKNLLSENPAVQEQSQPDSKLISHSGLCSLSDSDQRSNVPGTGAGVNRQKNPNPDTREFAATVKRISQSFYLEIRFPVVND